VKSCPIPYSTHALSARRPRGRGRGQIVGSGPRKRGRHEEGDVVSVLATHGAGPTALTCPRSSVFSRLVPHAASEASHSSGPTWYLEGCNHRGPRDSGRPRGWSGPEAGEGAQGCSRGAAWAPSVSSPVRTSTSTARRPASRGYCTRCYAAGSWGRRYCTRQCRRC